MTAPGRPALGTQFKALMGFAREAVNAISQPSAEMHSVHQAFEVLKKDIFVPAGVDHKIPLATDFATLPTFCRDVAVMAREALSLMPDVPEEITGDFLAAEGVEWSTLLAVKQLYPYIFVEELSYRGVSRRFFDQAARAIIDDDEAIDYVRHVTPVEVDIFTQLCQPGWHDREKLAGWFVFFNKAYVKGYASALEKKKYGSRMSGMEQALLQNPRIAALYRQKNIKRLSIEGTDVASIFFGIPSDKKVLFIDFPPQNFADFRLDDAIDDAIIADHHAEGMEGETATSQVWKLVQNDALRDVARVVGNHMDTDRVMAEALARGLIYDPEIVEKALAAAKAGDYLVGGMEAMKANWIIMSMIHGARDGSFEKVPEEEIVAAVPEILSNPETFEKYYQGMVAFMEASTATVRTVGGKVRGVKISATLVLTKEGSPVAGKDYVTFVDTGDAYAHPLAAYQYYKGYEGAPHDLIVKRNNHPQGGWTYEIGMVPEKNIPAQYNLAAAFEELKRLEAEHNPNFDSKDNWGYDPSRAGGSPRGYGSVLTAEQVLEVVERLIIGRRIPKK